jgi:hypothetical protein
VGIETKSSDTMLGCGSTTLILVCTMDDRRARFEMVRPIEAILILERGHGGLS